MGILIGILVIWLVISVIGFVIKSLFWLGIIGVILFVATAAIGAFRGKSITR